MIHGGSSRWAGSVGLRQADDGAQAHEMARRHSVASLVALLFVGLVHSQDYAACECDDSAAPIDGPSVTCSAVGDPHYKVRVPTPTRRHAALAFRWHAQRPWKRPC